MFFKALIKTYPRETAYFIFMLITSITLINSYNNIENRRIEAEKEYIANNYDVRKFHFICNDEICEVRQIKENNEIKYVDKIDISQIEKFSFKEERVPKTNSPAWRLYADCKDGTSFMLTPIFLSRSTGFKKGVLDPLNEALEQEKISINMRVPFFD